MKQLKVTIYAVCEVPDEFKLTPTNYGMFAIKHRDDDGTERQMSVTGAEVSVKEPKATKRAKAT